MDFQIFYKILSSIIKKSEIDEGCVYDNYKQYLMNRYLSFHPHLTVAVNEICNRQDYIPFDDDEIMCYKYTKAAMPSVPFAKINYYKRELNDKVKNTDINDEEISCIARNMELSEREIHNMLLK